MARRRKALDELPDDDESEEDVHPRGRRRGRKRWRLLFVIVALAVAVVTGPSIIAKSPLRNLALSAAVPPSVGRLACTDAVLSWTGGQGLAGVSFIDAAGVTVFTAETATVSRSLLGLASNRGDLGTITLTRPVIHVETRADGSNLEDVLRTMASAAAPPAPASPAGPTSPLSMTIEVVDGAILGRDRPTGQEWRVDALTLTAKQLADLTGWDITAAGVTKLSTPGQPVGVAQAPIAAGEAPGRFKVRLHPEAGGGTVAGGGDAPARGAVEIVADRLPLAPLEPWLARVLPAARLTGDASADLKITWNYTAAPPPNPSAPQPPASSLQPLLLTAAGNLTGSNIRFTADALSGDLVELPSATIALDAALADNRLTAKNCTARADWLDVELNGDFDLAEIGRLSLKSLPTSDAAVTARVDLPQLTRMLPRTLRLRPGVRVDAGAMEITARSASEAGARRWTLAAAVQDLMGSDGVRPIRWTAPVEIGLDAAQGPAGPQLERAILRSTFATATADGTAGGLEGELRINLEELGTQAGQFVDLTAWRLRGTGEGEFSWRDTGDNRFAASAALDLKDIDVQRDGRVVWQDPEVHVEAQANGDRDGVRPRRFELATLTMRGPGDTLSAELVEPVDLVAADQAWAIRLTGAGPLERWAGRVRPWVAGVPEQLAGQATLTAQLRARAGFVHVTQSDLGVENFRGQVGATTIVEPRIKATGDLQWDAAARSIASDDFQLTSSTVAGRARGVSVQFSDAGPPTARGTVAFRGDLERMSAWGDLLGAAPTGLRPRGAFEGQLRLASDADRATSTLSVKAEPLQLVSAVDGAVAWNEPRVELAAETAYVNREDRLQLSSVRLTGKTVQLTGAGVVEQLRGAGLVRADVNLSYDAAELAKLLAAYLGPNVQLQGANTARLQASGTLRTSPVSQGGGILEAATVSTAANADTTWNAAPQPSGLQPPASSLSPHWSRRWQVATEAGWTAANLYGLPVGPARLTANIRDGQVEFTPLELTVGQGGRVSLQPRVTLDPAPQALDLAPGQLASNVAISAEVSERMLKFAAPIVAGATRAEGSFSFFMEGAHIPLRQPKQGQLKGRLTVHNLSITPGPMIQSVATLVRSIEGIGKAAPGAGGNPLEGLLGGVLQPQQPAAPIRGVTMTERAIDVQVVDGRVYHRNLEFLVDDVPVRSQGSVGFDETLALEIEVPIQAKWVGNKPALQSLVGQPIRIPVTGTFAQPNVDERAIGAFFTQAAGAAAGGVLGDELNKAFDKLLRPK